MWTNVNVANANKTNASKAYEANEANANLADACRKHFAQPSNSTTREECAAFGWTKTTGEGRKKRVCLEYQNGFFMIIKTDSYKAQICVCLAQTSKEMHMKRDVSVCLVQASYVGIQGWCGGSANSYPSEVLGSKPQTWLNGLAC